MSTLYMRMIKGHYCIVSIYNDDNVGITDDSVANIAVSNKWSSVHQFISSFKMQFSITIKVMSLNTTKELSPSNSTR